MAEEEQGEGAQEGTGRERKREPLMEGTGEIMHVANTSYQFGLECFMAICLHQSCMSVVPWREGSKRQHLVAEGPVRREQRRACILNPFKSRVWGLTVRL